MKRAVCYFYNKEMKVFKTKAWWKGGDNEVQGLVHLIPERNK